MVEGKLLHSTTGHRHSTAISKLPLNVAKIFILFFSILMFAFFHTINFADGLSSKFLHPGRWNQIHDHGTSHVSIVDSKRNAISMTNTVNAYFGSKILSPSTGIVLNNEMDDFSMPSNSSGNIPPPAPPNFVRPGKRPLSSMTPTIVLKVCCFKHNLTSKNYCYSISGWSFWETGSRSCFCRMRS